MRGQSGFTLVELLVAAFILLVGMLGVLGVMQRGLATTALNAQRVAATNLGREVIENARATDYDQLTPSLLATALQAKPNMGSGSPWKIERRNTTFTVTASVCTFDDPSDKLAASAPTNQCTPAPTGNTGDQNGDDFRRVTLTMTWTGKGKTRTMTQTALVVNPSGGLGPRITSHVLTPAGTIGPGATQAVFDGVSTTAAAVHWNADDGQSLGNAVPKDSTGTKWSIIWDLKAPNAAGAILDGTYSVIAQAFDDRDIPGDAKVATVVINRLQPFAPTPFGGGHDTRNGDWVDLQWGFNPERDVLGYRVYWAGPDGNARTADDVRICPAAAAGATAMLDGATSSCADVAPPAGATKYFAVAIDRDLSGALREGDTTVLGVQAPSVQPAPPQNFQGVVDANPTFTWAAPASGSVSFYRIYRGGTTRGDRVGVAGAVAPLTFSDFDVTTGTHDYWITAVDSTYNESVPVGPLTWTGP
jgi:prepilin-type N-terminal cleavage/methylation domain-containing protein